MEKNYQASSFHTSAEALKAMAHPDRLSILSLISKTPKGRLTVKEIYESLGLQQPAVSHHLAILKSSGVVYRVQEGQKTIYGLRIKKQYVSSLLDCFG